MSYDDRPRIMINWNAVRPKGWRGWLTAAGVAAAALGVLALIAIVASTLLIIALIVGAGSAIAFFVGNLFRRKGRDVGPYRGNYDA
jgi:hypothetical protein